MEDKQFEEALQASIEKSFNDNELDEIMNEIENLEREFSEDQGAADNLSLKQARDNDLQRVIDAEVESINNAVSEVSEEPTMEASESETEEPMGIEMSDADMDALANMDSDDEEVTFGSDASSTEVEASQSTTEAEEIFDEEDFAQMSEDGDTVSETSVDEVVTENDHMFTAESEMDAIAQQMDEADTFHNVVEMKKPTTTQTASPKAASYTASSSSSASATSGVEFNANGAMNLAINFTIAGEKATLTIEDGALTVNMNGVVLTIDEETGCCVKMDQGVQFSVPLKTAKAQSKAS